MNDSTPPPPFIWHEFDISDELPSGWDAELIALANSKGKRFSLVAGNSITSRELDSTTIVEAETVDGYAIKEDANWLFELYKTRILSIVQATFPEEVVSSATSPTYALNLNIQRGKSMRYECHVDSNPIQGMLYVTEHPAGAGGELIVAKESTARGPAQIEANSIRIHPKKGHLVLFDARQHPHFVARLAFEDAIRVAVAMNFYTLSSPESERPPDLTCHLFNTSGEKTDAHTPSKSDTIRE